MVSKMALSDDLRKAIAESGKTINAIANESGISHPVLGRFMRGERGITIATADRLAEYFKLRLFPEGPPKSAPKRKK